MRSFCALLAVLVLASLAAAAAAAAASSGRARARGGRAAQRIVGGEPTTIERFPFMASMMYNWFGVWWFQACGGSLLTSGTVLSAAHCYVGDVPQDWGVRLGSSYAETGGVLSDVSQLTLHPDYDDPMLRHDVAIVRLASPATMGPTIGTVLIAGREYVLPDGEALSVPGWGFLQHGGPSSEQLQVVENNIINQEVCAERYDYLRTQPGFQSWPVVTAEMFCSGVLDVGGRDACDGDSGGPLVHQQNVAYGITSWGFQCAHQHYPGVNVRVSNYTDWIVANGSN